MNNSIAAVLQPYVDRHALAGAVTLVASRTEVLAQDAVGWADIAAQKSMQPDTVFWVASQTKPITATALMMLVDEGRVATEDPVEKYLPEFKGQMVIAEQDADHVLLRKPGHPPTVREVLSHTSGLPFSSPMEQPTLDVLPLGSAVRSYALLPLQTEPGSKYAYSNAGINTAGRILEVVSGMPYEKFLQTRLFRPLGMKDTTFWPNAKQTQRLAKSYKPDAGKSGLEETPITQLQAPFANRRRGPIPGGGLFSTAPDLGRFCQMILNGGVLNGKRYLSEAGVKQMSSKQTGSKVADEYGFGWGVNADGFGHGGAYSTNMVINLRRGLVLVWMVQHAGFPLDGDKSQAAFKQAAEEQLGGRSL